MKLLLFASTFFALFFAQLLQADSRAARLVLRYEYYACDFERALEAKQRLHSHVHTFIACLNPLHSCDPKVGARGEFRLIYI